MATRLPTYGRNESDALVSSVFFPSTILSAYLLFPSWFTLIPMLSGILGDMDFDFKSLPPGTMFFDWNEVPVTVAPNWDSATAWLPAPEPRNPSDVREKADPVDKAGFDRVFKAFASRAK